jgi:hypothetical protein
MLLRDGRTLIPQATLTLRSYFATFSFLDGWRRFSTSWQAGAMTHHANDATGATAAYADLAGRVNRRSRARMC